VDQFSYLSVLLSIVLGLGIANLLTGFARVIQMRTRVKLYWPVLVWAFTLVLIHIQTWWMMFGMQQRKEWTFAVFALVLVQPVLLFFLSALIWPDFDHDEELDLRANYFAQKGWLFAILIAIVLFSLLRTFVLVGHLQPPLDLAFHGLLIVTSAAGIALKNELYHKVTAATSTVLIVVYIAVLFADLQ
jgi:hypothetical protein